MINLVAYCIFSFICSQITFVYTKAVFPEIGGIRFFFIYIAIAAINLGAGYVAVFSLNQLFK